MSIYRKKSTNSQTSFTILDESQDSLKPKSACSIGCDPIFEWKDYSDSSTNCDISIPIDQSDFDASGNDNKENQARAFWKRAVAVRQESIDELNESADEISFRSIDVADEVEKNQIKWDRVYTNCERAKSAKVTAGDNKENESKEDEAVEEGEEVQEEEEEEESEGADADDEEEENDNSYQRLDESDDQESE